MSCNRVVCNWNDDVMRATPKERAYTLMGAINPGPTTPIGPPPVVNPTVTASLTYEPGSPLYTYRINGTSNVATLQITNSAPTHITAPTTVNVVNGTYEFTIQTDNQHPAGSTVVVSTGTNPVADAIVVVPLRSK